MANPDEDEIGYPGTIMIALVGYCACDMRPSPDGAEVWVSWGGPRLARVIIPNPQWRIPRGHVLFVRGEAEIDSRGCVKIIAEDWFSLTDPRRRAMKPHRQTGPVSGVFVRANHQIRPSSRPRSEEK